MTTLNLTIAVDGDDGWWASNGGYQPGLTTMFAGTTGGDAYHSWHRFASVSGLQNVRIDSAVLSLYRGGTDVGTPDALIKAEIVAAPTAPSSQANADVRTLSTASVAFTGLAGSGFNTYDITTVIQELVDRGLNPSVIQIMVKNNAALSGSHYAEWRARESSTSESAKLDITYTAYTVETFSTAGSGTWTAPTGVTSVIVRAWGGSGGGGRNGGGGGGGGAYAQSTVSVTAGNGYARVVGAAGSAGTGGAGGNGGATSFDTTTVVAAAGSGGGQSSGSGGAGGTTGASTGTITKAGGTGGAGNSGHGGGGGGGSGGETTGGGTGGSGVSNDSGGAGGTAGTSNGTSGGQGGAQFGAGAQGTAPGGGAGGGGGFNGSGAAGRPGQLQLLYIAAASGPVIPVFMNQYRQRWG